MSESMPTGRYTIVNVYLIPNRIVQTPLLVAETAVKSWRLDRKHRGWVNNLIAIQERGQNPFPIEIQVDGEGDISFQMDHSTRLDSSAGRF